MELLIFVIFLAIYREVSGRQAEVLSRAPGPKYKLPPTLGFDGHDPTLERAPGLTIAPARIDKMKPKAPGPKYDCSGLSRTGPIKTREAYLEGKPKYIYPRTPGPLNYGTQECPDIKHDRPPAWYFGDRPSKTYKMEGPAPKYMLPEITGKEIPHLANSPAYSISGRSSIKLPKTCSPGPGRYPTVDISVNLKRTPTPQIIGKPKVITRYQQSTPAPKYHCEFNEKIEPPSYSFGVKHSPYKTIIYTALDRQPYYGF